MQSNKKTNNHSNSSPMRDSLWFIYKWFLTGLAVYFCYRCLHFSPLTFHIVELVLCAFVIIGFATIIKHHATAKRAADYPKQLIVPSLPAVVGGILSWLVYIRLAIYFFNQLTIALGEFLVLELSIELVAGVVTLIVYLIAPMLVKSIIDPFTYLNKRSQE